MAAIAEEALQRFLRGEGAGARDIHFGAFPPDRSLKPGVVVVIKDKAHKHYDIVGDLSLLHKASGTNILPAPQVERTFLGKIKMMARASTHGQAMLKFEKIAKLLWGASEKRELRVQLGDYTYIDRLKNAQNLESKFVFNGAHPRAEQLARGNALSFVHESRCTHEFYLVDRVFLSDSLVVTKARAAKATAALQANGPDGLVSVNAEVMKSADDHLVWHAKPISWIASSLEWISSGLYDSGRSLPIAFTVKLVKLNKDGKVFYGN